METNETRISGVITEIEAQRTSPGGIVHQRLVLQHRSRQEQAGKPREVNCMITTELRGQLAQQWQTLQVNDRIEVLGFLSRSSYQEGAEYRLILQATSIEKR